VEGSCVAEARAQKSGAEQRAACDDDGLFSENWTVIVSISTLVSAEEAQRLLARGYVYVDVRSESEFLMGRPPGALNVPLQRVEGDRLVDNPEFLSVIQRLFRTPDPLIIGCRSGSRSHVALALLEQAGFQTLVELRHGFLGARDGFGRRLPGWVQAGLPVEDGDPEARSYARLIETVRGPERC
jgi:rhodanese-related sulfurtransferase